MPRFSVARIFADWPSRIPELTLGPKRRAAIRELIGFVNFDPAWSHLRHVAYTLATVRHEAGSLFRPRREIRAPAGTKHRRLQDRYWYTGYYGRGYVQLTWDWNYKKAGIALAGQSFGGVRIEAETLLRQPDLLLQPAISYAVLARGMREGWFTGKKLSDFITPTTTDYVRARRTVNGSDKADLIAGYAAQFELLLRASLVT